MKLFLGILVIFFSCYGFVFGQYQNLSKEEILTILKNRKESTLSQQQQQAPIIPPIRKEFPKDSISLKAYFFPTEESLTIFGFDFFNTRKLNFTPSTTAPVTENYILGTGDEVFINIYGYSQQLYNLMVERNGAIVVPSVGPIFIRGLSLKEARNTIKAKLRSVYQGMRSRRPNTFVNISLGDLRNINVNVIGEAYVPGTYTLPAGSYAFSALYLSGGPNENGSFRKIDLIRNGQVFHTIDVYKYLIDGNSLENIQLRDQDILLIRPYIYRIKLTGEFKRIGLFESKVNETIDDIIRFAGGFTENAYTQRLELTRNNNRTKLFKDVTPEEFTSIYMQNGDELNTSEIIDKFENRVFITGAVYKEGAYELTPNLHLNDLIRKAEGLKEDAFLERGVIIREGEDLRLQSLSFSVKDVVDYNLKIPLQKEDSVIISSIFDLSEKQEVEIKGFVNNPGEFDYSKGMTLKDIIFLAGGFQENASFNKIEVARKLNPYQIQETTQDILYSFELDVDRNLSISDQEFLLDPFDKIYVRQAPGYSPFGAVEITGAIEAPGTYSILSLDDRVSDILKRAGAFKKNSNITYASLRRKRELSESEFNSKVKIALEQRIIDSTLIGEEVEKTETYNVGLNLVKILENPGGKHDLNVQNNDEIIIPEINQTIRVSGAVLNPTAVVYDKKLKVKDYINQSGGFALNAKKSKVYVVYPNGNAYATKTFIFCKYPKVEPGSQIVVLEKTKTASSDAVSKWLGVSASTATLVSTILGIIAITKN